MGVPVFGGAWGRGVLGVVIFWTTSIAMTKVGELGIHWSTADE
jgi:hypothetical protein